MKFLADMGVPQSIVEWLRRMGHDAVHLRDQGYHRMPDGEIFRKANAEQRVLLTFDLDFSEIVALSQDQKVGVIIFRLRNGRASNVMTRLQEVLRESADVLEKGAVVSVEESRHRTRLLPIR